MDVLIGSFVLRPYVFVFLGIFLAAGTRDLGWRRTLLFWFWVWPVAWIAEYSSTRSGVPFGLYRYTELTRGQELYIANVPFFDSLSFTFLAYAAFCVARRVLGSRAISRVTLPLLAGVLMMAMDLVIDPLAVRGDQWFLGRIFSYPDGGVYFGVPLTNFLGWVIVGAVGVAGYLLLTREFRAALGPVHAERPGGGVALYYAVVSFNLAVTVWIGAWMLAAAGAIIHAGAIVAMACLSQRAESGLGFAGASERLARRGTQGA